jgi:ribosomal protein S18 acetylase RimI-like enzyme
MTDVAERAHQNLCDFVRFQARLAPGTELLDEPGIVGVSGAVDFPSVRMAIRSAPVLAAKPWADAAIGYFDARGKSSCVFTRAGADDDLYDELTARNYHEFSQSPEMVCDGPLESRQPPAGVTVRFASSAADVSAYARIAGKAFTHLSLPENLTRDAIDNPEVMLGSDCMIALAEVDGSPVAGASAMLFGQEPAGYVGWVACLDEARGRGLGDVVTRAVTNQAFARGASLLTLEASHFGESTYARMGYREIYRYRVLIRMEP